MAEIHNSAVRRPRETVSTVAVHTMTYEEKLIRRVRDSEAWPGFERPEFLEELDEVANTAFAKDTIEGSLASMLIYHQLSEEMLRLLVRDSQFFIQLAVFPSEIVFPERRRMTYGQVIDDLQGTISFPGKNELLDKANELNGIRIDLVHRLTAQTTLAEIKDRVVVAKALHHEMFELFDKAHDHFRVCFKDFRKDVFIDYP